ncbi:MAG TPA: hypothetical protein VFB58_13770 [Chloroflexota bacterium]|nr:hypothetical protein [Chloroflexota bacterium]
MPLTPRNIAHIQAKLATIWEGRTQPVVFTLRQAGGGTTTLTVNALWHPNADLDPAYADPQGHAPGADVLCMVAGTDMTLQQIRSALYAAPQSLLANEPATRYLITSLTPRGTMAGGDRYVLTLTRQR